MSQTPSSPAVFKTNEAATLRDLTPLQWKSGIAAWLGWLFDGMDGTLYTLVAAPFVLELLKSSGGDTSGASVREHSSLIQAAFLIGWATGGALFGRVGDWIGRSRTISLTILTYAMFTGLSAFSHAWWHLLIFRFLAALGIGGEWAAGSSLISETWPKKWRPWLSAVLQTAYQGGYFLASAASMILASRSPRYVFLVGALPALLVFWIRRAIPEPEEWHTAKERAQHHEPRIRDLFRGAILKTTILTILVCSAALTTVWALIFWGPQQLQKLPELASWDAADKQHFVTLVVMWTTLTAAFGNFFAAFMAKTFGYRASAATMFFGGLVTMFITYHWRWDRGTMMYFLPVAHFFVQGIFGLFPLYVPPLFPTLLRTTGAGFCYNVGRLAAAFGTYFFGTYIKDLDYNTALVYVGYLYIPAIVIALLIPEPPHEDAGGTPVE